MNYPCELIQDLLPLYIDNIAAPESRLAVEAHLSECETCRKCLEAMRREPQLSSQTHHFEEDKTMADSLKKVKKRMNQRTKTAALCSVAVVLVIVFGWNLLFDLPIREIHVDDIQVSAAPYPMESVAKTEEARYDSVIITGSETDPTEVYKLELPEIPNLDISVTENTMEQHRFVSIITWSSPYHIRQIKYGNGSDKNTLYVESFRTTLLNNKIGETAQSIQHLEFREVNRIVFVGDGQEQVLWSK